MTFGVRFGLLVRRYREAQGLSSTELAAKALGDKAKRSRISEIENGKVKAPHARTIDLLVGYLVIPLEEVDACRQLPKASPAHPLPQDTDLPAELLENLAQRFGIENPDQPPTALAAFLKQKAKDYTAMQQRLAELAAEDERMANGIAAAKAALADGNFEEADARLADLEEVQQESRTLVEIRKQANLRIERGNGALLNGKTEQAFDHFKRAAAYVEPFDPDEACEMRFKLEDQLYAHGLRYGSDGMAWSASLLKLNFGHWSKEGHPEKWAKTQNSLAIALWNQAERVGGEAGTHLLDEAITAYRDALTVRTKAEHPVDWAMTQNNLAIALWNQASRVGGEAGTHLLTEAITACRDALTVRTKAEHPVDWAMTQNNLALALADQASRAGGEAGTHLLSEAITACRDALTVRTKAEHPVQWATTQNNLAIALRNQAIRVGGEAGTHLLAEAITAYRDALTVRTKAEHPVDWAMTQENIALVFETWAELEPGKARQHLKAALKAVTLSLEVFDPVHMPYNFNKATELKQQLEARLAAL